MASDQEVKESALVLIVGAGPGGLATARCLEEKRIPFIILEREDCTAPLWRNWTYDCLHLHLPKETCSLPLEPFPQNYPKYPCRNDILAHFDHYASKLDFHQIVFNTTVTSAKFCEELKLWVVMADQKGILVCYTTTFLVVATGENGEPVVPLFPGHENFTGQSIHGKDYKNGVPYVGQKVLLVGVGNTGMEIALDLSKAGAKPTILARSMVHVMPRDLVNLWGINVSTIGMAQRLLKVFPMWFVDEVLVLLSWLKLGSTARYNLIRPKDGPLTVKARGGMTPVLDVGTMREIKRGNIKVVRSAIECLTGTGVRFQNGVEEEFDAIIMATGYKSTVSKWLKDDGMFSQNGFPKAPFPNGWKGEFGLYAVGFGRRGLAGCTDDAMKVAEDIYKKTI